MFVKLVNFSELSKFLSVKSRLSADLLSLFGRFGLGHLLSRLSLEKLLRFICILRREGVWAESENSCLILDDTTLEKTGYSMERVSRVFDHVQGKCVLGFKLLLCAFFDGKTTIPFDFSIHREKGKKKDFGLTKKQRKEQFSKKRSPYAPDCTRLKESDMSKLDVTIEMIRRAWKAGLRARYV